MFGLFKQFFGFFREITVAARIGNEIKWYMSYFNLNRAKSSNYLVKPKKKEIDCSDFDAKLT